MNSIRDAVGAIFQSPMNQMSFPAYFAYVNTAGKVTSRSMMETIMVCLTYLEEQEKQIKELKERKDDTFVGTGSWMPKEQDGYSCPICQKVLKNDFGLKGHMRSHNKTEK